MSKIITNSIKPKKPFVQFLVPFYKDKYVNGDQVIDWFRFYNYFYHSTVYESTRFENFIQAKYSPPEYESGVMFVGNGHLSLYTKYIKWSTVKHRIIIEFGRSTTTGWFLDEQIESKNYDHITENKIKSTCDYLSDREIEFYDIFNHQPIAKETPRNSFINSIKLIDFIPPYASLDITCQGDIQIVNLVFKLIKLLDCPIVLIDADRYDLEGIKKADCLTKTDIYWPYIVESRSKYSKILLHILKKYEDKEQLKLPTYSRYKLYV